MMLWGLNALIAFFGHGLASYRRYREEQLRFERARVQLVQALLETLRMQLHPHFLYNALNAITALILTDRRAAVEATSRLGDLLKTTLDREHTHEIPLRQEMELLQQYLKIQYLRFSDRLLRGFKVYPIRRSFIYSDKPAFSIFEVNVIWATIHQRPY